MTSLREPRRKKYYKSNKHLPLPMFENSNKLREYLGFFNGFSVTIESPDDMFQIYLNGFFGKGNLSRSYPSFIENDKKVNIIRKRQFLKRKFWSEKFAQKKIHKILVVPDSDSENEDYFRNLKPEYEIDSSYLKEHLQLSLEEAFFLFEAVKCLKIYHNKAILNSEEAWMLFSQSDKSFVPNYIVYHYFRTKNWVVKPGLKFGGDFLLYKEGPAFYHASYVVIIDVLDKTLKRKEEFNLRSMEVTNIIGLNRLCETAGKELLICEVILPDTEIKGTNDLKNVSIKEILMKRWILLHNNE